MISASKGVPDYRGIKLSERRIKALYKFPLRQAKRNLGKKSKNRSRIMSENYVGKLCAIFIASIFSII